MDQVRYWFCAGRLVLVAAIGKRGRLCLASAALVAAACTPTALVHQWSSHEHQGQPFNHVLVLAATSDIAAQRVYEDAFVQELAAMGVTAVGAHAVIQTEGEVPEERILQVVEEVHADALLTIRMIGKDPRTGTYSPPPLQPATHADFYAVYQSGTIEQTPPKPYGYGVYTLESSLWDAKDESLVWSSTSQTFQPYNVPTIAKELSDVVVKALRRQRLL